VGLGVIDRSAHEAPPVHVDATKRDAERHAHRRLTAVRLVAEIEQRVDRVEGVGRVEGGDDRPRDLRPHVAADGHEPRSHGTCLRGGRARLFDAVVPLSEPAQPDDEELHRTRA
jgi:hypothetical protein